ncbi:MAG TPA: tetratricopeptide repeat protein, partial [Pyrinomonadaceae bacterium]|nr:tetratricopeptide repeat protein [Pyrinomonadaceae bacterium]
VQLVGVRDRRPLWAQSFDEKFTDIFTVQDSISEQVARAMLLELNGEERRRLRRHGTENVEAFQAYLRGRHFWNKRNEEGLTKSVEHFQRAIDLDAAYAQAYAGLADAYNVLANYHFGPLTSEECFRRSKWAVTRALEIDDTLAEAHASLALVKTYFERDDAAAETSYRRAIELNPYYATAHHWYSDFLAFRGRDAEALSEIQRAAELDPLSPIISTTLAERFYFARRYDEAVAQLRRTLDLEADFIQARYILGLAYEQQGRYDDAIAELRRARDLSEGKTDSVLAALGHAYAAAGRHEEARSVLDELLRRDYVAPYEVALLFAGLGQREQALDWLRKARDKAPTQATTHTMLHTDPRLDRLRSDPEFRHLLGA